VPCFAVYIPDAFPQEDLFHSSSARFARLKMRSPSWAAVAWLAFCRLGQVAAAAVPDHDLVERHSNGKIAPKFFIISMVSGHRLDAQT